MSVAVERDFYPGEKFVFNHDLPEPTLTSTSDPTFSANALGISEPWDIVQLHPDLKTEWEEISSHYNRIGLTHSKEVVWSLNPRELAGHIGYHPSVALFGPRECQYWGDYEWLTTADWIRANNNFLLLANEFNIRVPLTLAFQSAWDVNEGSLNSIRYPCFIKPAFPAPGLRSQRCRDQYELRDALQQYPPDLPLQIQEAMLADALVNLHYRVHGEQVLRLAACEIMSDNSSTEIRSAMLEDRVWHAVEPMAFWLKDRGMKGIFSFDIGLEVSRAGISCTALKCWPGFNQASYCCLIAEKLGIGEWSAIEFRTRHHRLEDLDIADIEFDKATGEGAIIVNWGSIRQGRITLMLAGSNAYQEALQIELLARL